MKNDELIARLRAAQLVQKALLAELLEAQGAAFVDQVLTRLQRDLRDQEVTDPHFHQLVEQEAQQWLDWPTRRGRVD